MANIEKRGNSYRIRKMIRGKMYSLTLDYKPRQSEADKLLYALTDAEETTSRTQTFENASVSYISSKDHVLSPATIREYKGMLGRIPKSFKIKPIQSISRSDVQILVNDYSEAHSPKSVRSLSGFISAIMRSVRPSWRNDVALPQKRDPEFYVPEKSDVKRIMDYAKGSKYELPLWLACFGLRRSEICAVEKSDLSGNELLINKALVLDSSKHWVIKTTKTASSVRKILLPDYVVQLIRKAPDGRLYTYQPGRLGKYLTNVQTELGIEHFSLHKLRHFFASTAREIMPDAYVEQAGGWKPGSAIMRKVYDYAQKEEARKAKEALASKLSEIL
jgi:integrase